MTHCFGRVGKETPLSMDVVPNETLLSMDVATSPTLLSMQLVSSELLLLRFVFPNETRLSIAVRSQRDTAISGFSSKSRLPVGGLGASNVSPLSVDLSLYETLQSHLRHLLMPL